MNSAANNELEPTRLKPRGSCQTLDSYMEDLPKIVQTKLREYRTEQIKVVNDHLSHNSNEMAYLARWSILEHMAKEVASEYRRHKLRISLTEWLNYLNDDGSRPRAAPKTEVELRSIPQKNELLAALEYFGISGDAVWSVMDTDSKGPHRRWRNELANTGKKFSNYLGFLKLFQELEDAIDSAFDQVEYNK